MIEFTARNRKERRGRPQHQSMLLLNPLARKELTCQESTRKAPTSERLSTESRARLLDIAVKGKGGGSLYLPWQGRLNAISYINRPTQVE